jgi:cyclin L
MSCIFLSSKLEENPIPIRDIINVFHFIEAFLDRLPAIKGRQDLQEDWYKPLEYYAEEFYKMKEELVVGEMQILKRLGFRVQIQSPHPLLINYLQLLSLSSHPIIPQDSWNNLNDLLITSLPATHPPNVLAASCIYLSCWEEGKAIPLTPRPWWELFDVEKEEQLLDISREILKLRKRLRGGWETWRRTERRKEDVRKRLESEGLGNGQNSG